MNIYDPRAFTAPVSASPPASPPASPSKGPRTGLFGKYFLPTRSLDCKVSYYFIGCLLVIGAHHLSWGRLCTPSRGCGVQTSSKLEARLLPFPDRGSPAPLINPGNESSHGGSSNPAGQATSSFYHCWGLNHRRSYRHGALIPRRPPVTAAPGGPGGAGPRDLPGARRVPLQAEPDQHPGRQQQQQVLHHPGRRPSSGGLDRQSPHTHLPKFLWRRLCKLGIHDTW